MSRARNNIFGNHGAVCSLITAQDVGYMMSPAVCGNIRLFAAIAGLLNGYAYRVLVELHPSKQRRDNLVIYHRVLSPGSNAFQSASPV
jgi:hypothetical protein